MKEINESILDKNTVERNSEKVNSTVDMQTRQMNYNTLLHLIHSFLVNSQLIDGDRMCIFYYFKGMLSSMITCFFDMMVS